jgi:hypothetical protein
MFTISLLLIIETLNLCHGACLHWHNFRIGFCENRSSGSDLNVCDTQTDITAQDCDTRQLFPWVGKKTHSQEKHVTNIGSLNRYLRV